MTDTRNKILYLAVLLLLFNGGIILGAVITAKSFSGLAFDQCFEAKAWLKHIHNYIQEQ